MEIKNTGDVHAIFRYKGKLILRTKRSFGSKSLDGNIPRFIRQQMKLNPSQFKDLIDCPLTLEKYILPLNKTQQIAYNTTNYNKLENEDEKGRNEFFRLASTI